MKFNSASRFSRFSNSVINAFRESTSKSPRANSMLVFMQEGSMRPGSLGRQLYTNLINAYRAKYEDEPDHEGKLAVISANFHHETEAAWQSFLAEVGAYDDED